VGERKRKKIKKYNEGPERGSKDKTWGDDRDQINSKNELTKAV
jgi:hypothetical protein